MSIETQQPANVVPMVLIERALEQGSLELVRDFLALQREYEAAEAKRAFNSAMAKLRADLPVIVKANKGPDGRYLYEDLADIARAIDAPLAEHGLSYRFRTVSEAEGKRLTVTCIVSHAAGHFEENSLTTAVAPSSRLMNDIQALGAAQTYLQRYALKSSLGLAASRDTDASTITPQAVSDAGECITAEQRITLEAALAARNMQPERLLKWARIKCPTVELAALGALPAYLYASALRAIANAEGEPQ
jgi:hypothetical protein